MYSQLATSMNELRCCHPVSLRTARNFEIGSVMPSEWNVCDAPMVVVVERVARSLPLGNAVQRHVHLVPYNAAAISNVPTVSMLAAMMGTARLTTGGRYL